MEGMALKYSPDTYNIRRNVSKSEFHSSGEKSFAFFTQLKIGGGGGSWSETLIVCLRVCAKKGK